MFVHRSAGSKGGGLDNMGCRSSERHHCDFTFARWACLYAWQQLHLGEFVFSFIYLAYICVYVEYRNFSPIYYIEITMFYSWSWSFMMKYLWISFVHIFTIHCSLLGQTRSWRSRGAMQRATGEDPNSVPWPTWDRQSLRNAKGQGAEGGTMYLSHNYFRWFNLFCIGP